MNIDEAIVDFEKQLTASQAVIDSGFWKNPGECGRIYKKQKEMSEIALQALRFQQAAEKNEPFTLEELREMDGQPVYCVSLHDGARAFGILRIVEVSNTWFISISGLMPLPEPPEDNADED